MRCSHFLNVRRPACLTLVLATVTCSLFLVTCNDDSPVRSKQPEPTVRLISKSTCKGTQESPPSSAASVCTQDYITLWTDSANTLHIKHINAAFNCCMESLTVTIQIKGEVALITESDNMESGGCRCICLYDAEYEISDLPASVHKIEIAEPYAQLDRWLEEPLCCSLVESATDTTMCCVDRCHYPWGRTLIPRISVVGVSGCKTDSSANPVYPSECAEWTLNNDNSLDIRHINAMFNCCLDSISARLELRGDTIMIIETEHTPLCDCNCPYDLDLRISNIMPGTYHFVIRYGVWDEGIPKLAWSADLTVAPTGTYCNMLCCGPD